MRIHKPRSIVLVFSVTLVGLAAAAADWPQWRGPGRDGISRETGLLKTWPEEGPKLVWNIDNLGNGYSTPSVVGDRIYLMSNQGDENEFVQALSTKDGAEVWKVRVGKVGPNTPRNNYPGARSTPTVDGDILIALGSDGDLACLERFSGNIRWQKNLRTDFGGKPGQWAYAESPLIDGNMVVCTPGGDEATLVALDKRTGDVIWKSPVPGGDEAAYASAIVVQTDGVKQYVQFLQNGLVGVDAKTGKFLWRYDKTAKGSPANIPSPIEHDGLVYSASGRAGGGLAKIKPTAEGFTAEEVYFSQTLPKAIGGVVLVEGHLYGTSGGLMCVDFKTGDVKWEERGVGAGGILYADGRLYVHGENNRQVALVEATPAAYREHGRFTPPGEPQRPDKAKAWAYPVVANGRLYIRDQNMLWCYDVRDPSAVR
jgi:outer membrane protein assembly factor BamB